MLFGIMFSTLALASEMEVLSKDLEIPKLPRLSKGSKGASVDSLVAALAYRGFKVEPKTPSVFDDSVHAAVMAAQERFGLVKDGIADVQLYANLSVGEESKSILLKEWEGSISSLKENAKTEGFGKMIVVNVPSFTMKVFDTASGEVLLESPVIVGKPARQTPIGRMNVVGIKYNPTWTPPPGIMRHDVLPRLGNEEKASWIDKHGLIIKDEYGDRVSPAEITREDFVSGGYSIHQPAGGDNALGVLKFETDNKDNIYLHDTNQRSLFDKAHRAQSSGCIRVKEWKKLGSLISGKQEAEIEKALASSRTYVERIGKVPVFVTYSRIDSVSGKTAVFPDVYMKKSNASLVRQEGKVGG